MCGIFGLVVKNKQHHYNMTKIVNSVKNTLLHRGPDYFGISVTTDQSVTSAHNVTRSINGIAHSSVKILLCHARLSIIDLNNRANQPLISEGFRHQIIFNGEIYNYKLLRKSLEQKGLKFTTSSDTEVLFKGLILEGKQFILKLEGMFSFAFFDRKFKQLILARDHFGIKPLYYHQDGSGFSFCSELPTLINSLEIKPSLNPTQLFDYLHYFGTSDYNNQTFFKNIYQLLPGHYLEYSLNSHSFKINKFWSAQLQDPVNITQEDAACKL